MGKNKVLVKVHPEGKYVVDLDKSIEMSQVCQSFPLVIQITSLHACASASSSFLWVACTGITIIRLFPACVQWGIL